VNCIGVDDGRKWMQVMELQRMVQTSLFAAFIAVGAYLAVPIPVSPVPIVLQNLFVLLAGLLLGPRWGLASVGVYILAGAVGLPVFVGGKGGIAHFLGPTGGYLIGFAACAFITGVIADRRETGALTDILAVCAGTLAIYAFGVPWLRAVTGMSWEKALLAGMLPFLIGDALKAAAAVILARALRPVLHRRMEAVSP
jgi:biotin transport system substrate-specific component